MAKWITFCIVVNGILIWIASGSPATSPVWSLVALMIASSLLWTGIFVLIRFIAIRRPLKAKDPVSEYYKEAIKIQSTPNQFIGGQILWGKKANPAEIPPPSRQFPPYC